jgi:hypothetical protein
MLLLSCGETSVHPTRKSASQQAGGIGGQWCRQTGLRLAWEKDVSDRATEQLISTEGHQPSATNKSKKG